MNSVYDQSLYEVGNENKYQKRFDLIYNILFMGFWSMTYSNIMLALAIMPYECKLPEKPENISEQDWKLLFIPRYEDNSGKTRFDNCQIFLKPHESNQTRTCDEYVYDNTWYDRTVPSEFNWVCDKELYASNIIAYSKVSEIIGSIFFGWFGDINGRRLTYVVSISMIVIGRTISLLAGSSYAIFVIGCIIAYLPSWSAPQTTSVISLEISSSKRRTTISSIRLVSSSIGLMIMALIYWWLRDWRKFFIVTTVPVIPFLIFSWKIIESPQWLYTKGRLQEAYSILNKIGKVNNRIINADTKRKLLTVSPSERLRAFGPLMLFTGGRLTINTVCLLILSGASSVSFTLLIIGAGEKTEANPFLDFAWQALIDIPAIYIAAWLSNKIGRRRTGIVSFIVTGTMWMCLALREHSSIISIRIWWMGSLFSIIARLSTTMSYFVTNLFNMEIYPTRIRESGMALGNVVAGIASSCSPYILYLGRRDSRLPGIILTIICLVGFTSSYILPETLNTKLPETLEEAKRFGRSKQRHETHELPILQPLAS